MHSDLSSEVYMILKIELSVNLQFTIYVLYAYVPKYIGIHTYIYRCIQLSILLSKRIN